MPCQRFRNAVEAKNLKQAVPVGLSEAAETTCGFRVEVVSFCEFSEVSSDRPVLEDQTS